jgi:glyoxylase-like metal-dependent hydrolase (beta-lactamase superfamily II)
MRLKWNKLINGVYLVKEKSNRVNKLNSLMIEDNGLKNSVLIDANYPFDAIEELYSEINTSKMLLFSHGHLDHTAHAFYHQEKFNTPLFCPIQEKEYLTNLDKLMERVGFKKLKLKEKYGMMVKNYIKFQECSAVNTFIPGEDDFDHESYLIESIHIPGHSPGHTAFKISLKNNNPRKILYVADIGSHPYYGDLNSDLIQYRKSIDKLETLYLNGDYILVPAHGNFYHEKDENFFNRIREKINGNKEKVINSLSKEKPQSLRELVEKRIITPKERIFEPIKELYYLWDGGMIHQHLNELIIQNRVKKIEKNDFFSHEYLLK